MLEDDEECPLLLKLAEPTSPYYRALARFQQRTLYANVLHDIAVPYSTAAIVPYNPFIAGERRVVFSHEYPHILLNIAQAAAQQTAEDERYEEDPVAKRQLEKLRSAFQQKQDLLSQQLAAAAYTQAATVTERNTPFRSDKKRDVLLRMVTYLHGLEWRRVDVHFKDAAFKMLSHVHIVKKGAVLNNIGSDVVLHLAREVFIL